MDSSSVENSAVWRVAGLSIASPHMKMIGPRQLGSLKSYLKYMQRLLKEDAAAK